MIKEPVIDFVLRETYRMPTLKENHGAVLSANRISKTFHNPRELKIFENLSLAVGRGEFVALVGESGCGKSTLLRVLAGLEPPDLGVVDVTGDGHSNGIAVVFQQPGLLPWRNVRENVRLPAELLRAPQLENRISDVLKLVGLMDFEHYFPHQISGGMQARTAIARALLTSPSVLLMDEPFSALDERTRSRLQFELLSVWESLTTSVLFITHSVSEAVLLSDTVLVMAGKPCKKLLTVRIDGPRPRTNEFCFDPRFRNYVLEIRRALEGAHYDTAPAHPER